MAEQENKETSSNRESSNILSQAIKSKNTARSDLIGIFAKKGSLIIEAVSLIHAIPVFIIFIISFIYLISKGVPLYIGGIFMLLIIAFFFLSLITIKRLASVNLDRSANQPAQRLSISVEPDETITFCVPGVMNNTGFRGSGPWLGKSGKVYKPENALIITSKHIHCIVVPLAGTGQIVGTDIGTDIGLVDWLIARQDIANKLSQMLSSMSLLQILQSDSQNYSLNLSDISQVKLSDLRHNITFIMQNKKKYTFSIRDNGDYQKLKQQFQK